jgi:PhnB protein
MTVQPYLFFNGRADEALAFYKKAIGAQEQMLMRFKENPGGKEHNPPASDDKVMHMAFKVGDALILGSDGHTYGKTNFQGFALAISVDDPAQAKKMYDALLEGGSSQMPAGETFFAKWFGMVTDKFGVGWMLLGGAKN